MKKIPKTTLFEHILKNQHNYVFGALLFIYVQFTPSQGLQRLQTTYLRNRTIEVWPCSLTMGICPLTCENSMVPDVNNPLALTD